MLSQVQQFKNSRNKDMIIHQKFGEESPYVEFTGIYKSFRQFRGFTKKVALGHLVFKNGNEFKGTFFSGNFSGLGQLKTKEGLYSGVFLDGLLIKPLNVNLDFDFKKMKSEYQGEALYVQGELGIDVLQPRFGQVDGGQFKGWVTKTFPKQLSYTTQLPIVKEKTPALLANNLSPDIRVDISPNFEFSQCAEYLFGDLHVNTKNPRSEGWNVGKDGVYFLTSYWFDSTGNKQKIPREMLTDDGLLIEGARSARSFRDFDSSMINDYPKIRASVLKQASEDKNFDCLSSESKSQIKGYLAALEVENKESNEALTAVVNLKKEYAEKNKMPFWEFQELLRQQTREALANQCEQTASCKDIHYHWEELTCNGVKVQPVWVSLRDVQKNYLTPTNAGLLTVTGRVRRDLELDDLVKVFNVHPNLGKAATYACEVCNGKGHLTTTQKDVSALSPIYEYRNGLEIRTTTTFTTYRTRYGGICGRCKGHGVVPAAWAYGR